MPTHSKPTLDRQLLEDIGAASTGHRLRLHDAIAKLAATSTAEAGTKSTAAASGLTSAIPFFGSAAARHRPNGAAKSRTGRYREAAAVACYERTLWS